ncbi:hypothetical protein ABIC24_003459 [Methylobacterium radiotolerans]
MSSPPEAWTGSSFRASAATGSAAFAAWAPRTWAVERAASLAGGVGCEAGCELGCDAGAARAAAVGASVPT